MSVSIGGLIWVLMGCAVAIAGLLYLIVRLVGQINAERANQEQVAKVSQRRKQKNATSIRVLAASLVEGQVEVAEAVIRLKVLLDVSHPELLQEDEYLAFNSAFEELQHIPTHDARAQLTPRERHRYDQVRWEIESRYQASVAQAAQRLLDRVVVPA